MDTNWLVLGGNEVINTARVQAYAAGCGGGQIGCACPGLSQAIEGPGGVYTDAVTDDAPWLDPVIAHSSEFLGVFGRQATGMGEGTLTRTPVELAQNGANIGVPRYRHREIGYEATLVAHTERGLSYGMSWLASVLRGQPCGGTDCWGTQACLFAWCPDGDADGDEAVRFLFDVGLIEGPTTDQTFQAAGGLWYRDVSWTLGVGNPHVYTSSYVERAWGDASVSLVRVPPGGPTTVCTTSPPCAPDPDCPLPPLPPLPAQPVDPCWPITAFRARRAMFSVPPGGVSSWFDSVPVVRIDTGDAPMRRLSMRFYANPTGQDCDRWTDRCLACGEANVAFLPAGSVLTFDGRRQRVELDCSGGRGLALSEPNLFGPGGGLFSWPVIECASGLCIEVMWEDEGASPDVSVSVEMVARQEAV